MAAKKFKQGDIFFTGEGEFGMRFVMLMYSDDTYFYGINLFTELKIKISKEDLKRNLENGTWYQRASEEL